MKTKFPFFNLIYFISLLLILFPSIVHAQEYVISFSASGQENTLEKVLVQNITQGTSVALSGGENLRLLVSDFTTDINSSNVLDEEINIVPSADYKAYDLNFYTTRSGHAQIQVFSINGQKIVSSNQMVNGGKNTFRLTIPQGVFAVSVTGEGYAYFKKILSQTNSRPAIQFVTNQPGLYLAKKAKKQEQDTPNTLPYKPGDELVYVAQAGEYVSEIVDIPTESKLINFNFEEKDKYVFNITTGGYKLGSIKTWEGEVVYYGARDEQGLPTAIDMAVMKSDTDTTTMEMDADSRPTKIIIESGEARGVTYKFNWVSATEAVVEMFSPDGEMSITQQIDFSQEEQQPMLSKTTAKSFASQPCQAGSHCDHSHKHSSNHNIQLSPIIQLPPHSKELDFQSSSLKTKQQTASETTVVIDLSRCAKEAGLQHPGDKVVLDVFSEDGNLIETFPTKMVGFSMAVCNVPTKSPADQNVCKEFAKLLKEGCKYGSLAPLEGLCAAVPVIGGPYAWAAKGVCIAAIKGTKLYCKYGTYEPVKKGNTPSSTMCDLLKLIDESIDISKTNFLFQARLVSRYETPKSKKIPVSVEELKMNAAPDLEIIMPGDKLKIEALDIVPECPSPKIIYDIQLSLSCIQEKTPVSIIVLNAVHNYPPMQVEPANNKTLVVSSVTHIDKMCLAGKDVVEVDILDCDNIIMREKMVIHHPK